MSKKINIPNWFEYVLTLEKALQEGAKYKDLLRINPQDYGLLEDGDDGSQYSSILEAIAVVYEIGGGGNLMLFPSLRSIAEEIEAPYSVLMDCYTNNKF